MGKVTGDVNPGRRVSGRLPRYVQNAVVPCAGLMDGLGCIALGGEGDSKRQGARNSNKAPRGGVSGRCTGGGFGTGRQAEAGRRIVVIAARRSSHGDER